MAPNKGVGNANLTGSQDPSSVNTMTPEELLLKAADYIAQHGHHKGTFYSRGFSRNPAACAYGAMFRAIGSNEHRVIEPETSSLREPVRSAAIKLAEQITRNHPGLAEVLQDVDDEWGVITTFNDHDHTTAEDVILAMKGAAE